MATAYLNTIATAVPAHNVHGKFVDYAPRLLPDEKSRALFKRMAGRAEIEHRYSFFEPHPDPDRLDSDGFFQEDGFPSTEARMAFYRSHAFGLARDALDQLDLSDVTHLIVTTCTGFYAPGLDLEIVRHYGLKPSVERTIVGFMGCYAAFNAMKLGRHIVRSDSAAKVLVLNLELCTLHLQQSGTFEEILSFLIFADGCAASIISANQQGLELLGFHTQIIPESAEQITWTVGGLGFDMNLSGKVPGTIAAALPSCLEGILGGCKKDDVAHWAVHPGGRTILDAVQSGASLPDGKLDVSRDILRRYGNMSSATIMFVLAEMLNGNISGQGCAMAFGPGLTVESMRFACAGAAR